MLGLWRHGGRVLETLEVLHDLVHLELRHAFFPDGVPPCEQEVHDDAAGPNVSFLRVGENVCHLLGWLVQGRSTLGEICDLTHLVVNGQAEINQLDLTQILKTPKDHIVGLDVSMDDVLLVVQIGQRPKQTLHDLGAHLLRQARSPRLLLVLEEEALDGVLPQLHLHYRQVLVLSVHLVHTHDVRVSYALQHLYLSGQRGCGLMLILRCNF